MDVMVIKENNGVISTDLFRMPTDARNYLHYKWAHPKSCKNGIPYSQFLRIRRICSDDTLFERNAIEITKSFIVRGYPTNLIENFMIRSMSHFFEIELSLSCSVYYLIVIPKS